MSVQQSEEEDSTETRPKGRDELKPLALSSRNPLGGRASPVHRSPQGKLCLRSGPLRSLCGSCLKEEFPKQGDLKRHLMVTHPVAVVMRVMEIVFV